MTGEEPRESDPDHVRVVASARVLLRWHALVVPKPGRPHGRLPEWPKGAVCKTVGTAYVGSNPTPATVLDGSLGLLQALGSRRALAGAFGP